MKLKNILSIFCFLSIVVSCSMEDETILNDISKEIDNSTENVAYVSVNIASLGTKTKSTATSSGSSEPYDPLNGDYISTCYLLLLNDEGKIINRSYTTYAYPGLESLEEIKVLTKVRSVSRAIAIVNSSISTDVINACDNFDDLQKKMIETDAFHRVKLGEGKIIWSADFEGSSSTKENVPVLSINDPIVVQQLTANIDLTKFQVKYTDGVETPEVRLTKVSFSNLPKTMGLFETIENPEYASTDNLIPSNVLSDLYDPNSLVIENVITPDVLNLSTGEVKSKGTELNHSNAFFLSVFPNQSIENPITMHMTFTVDGKEDTRTYIINRPTDNGFNNQSGHDYVEAGYWYHMKLILHVTSAGIGELEVTGWKEVIIGGDGVEFK